MGNVENKKYATQVESMNLLKILDALCEENGLSYSLFGNSMLGQYLYKKMPYWEPCVKICMFYEDMLILKKKFLEKFAMNSDYYWNDIDTGQQHNELYVQVKKKSRVILPEDRKLDESYYDFSLIISPIFYAGNTRYECMKKSAYYRRQYRLMNTNKPIPGQYWMWFKLRGLKRAYRYLKRKKRYGTREAQIKELRTKLLLENKKSKYVFFPIGEKQRKIVRLASTYEHTTKVKFGENEFSCVVSEKQWLNSFYTKKQLAGVDNVKVNQTSLEGPEQLRRIQLILLEMLKDFDSVCRANNIQYTLFGGTLLGAVRHKGFIPWDDDVDVVMLYEEYLKFEAVSDQMDPTKYFLKTQKSDKDNHLTMPTVRRLNTIYSKGGRDTFETHRGIPLDILPSYNGANSLFMHRLQHILCMHYKMRTWAHMGADSERKFLKRMYYKFISRKGNKDSYNKYFKYATMFKKDVGKRCWLTARRNTYNCIMNVKSAYTEIEEMEFEGTSFFVSKDYAKLLTYLYSGDYMEYPKVEKRIAIHTPADIEIGDLYMEELGNGIYE